MMVSLDEATAVVLRHAVPLDAETIPLDRAMGRLLAADITAARTSPPCSVSAMDGYAVVDHDLRSSGVTLSIVGEARAGQAYGGRLISGECARIFTGASLPAGAERVVMQEDVTLVGDAVHLSDMRSLKRHVRQRGSDFTAGDVLVRAGQRLTPQALVAAAAADRGEVVVWRQPRVIILSTGDELVAPGQASEGGDRIPDSVSLGVEALVRAWGGRVIGRLRLSDDLPGLRRAAAAAVEDADLVVVTGGASVGEHDLSRQMFQPLQMLFAKVAIKPGKPVWFARSGGALVLGLPGNPTAAMVTARLFLAPLVAGLSGGGGGCALAWRRRPLAAPLPCGGERDQILCGWLKGAVHALGVQDSSGQKALAQTDLLIRRRANAPALACGDSVEVLSF